MNEGLSHEQLWRKEVLSDRYSAGQYQPVGDNCPNRMKFTNFEIDIKAKVVELQGLIESALDEEEE